MAVWSLVVLLALTSCGRIGFGLGAANRDAGADDSADSSVPIDAEMIPAGPLVWLNMDNGPAGGIVDSAGGHPAACVTTCPVRMPGVHGGAYTFATEEIVINGIGTDLDIPTGFSGAAWVRPSMVPSSRACAWNKPFNGPSGYDTFSLCLDPTGATVFDCETPTGTPNEQIGPMIVDGSWHHMAMTWDGTTKRDYVDGVQVGATPIQIGHSNESLTLGGERNAYYFPGQVDDALYYGRALTAAEIQQLATP